MKLPARARWLVSLGWRLALVILLLGLGELLRQTLGEQLAHLLPPLTAEARNTSVAIFTVFLIILLALPFVPGAEIGLAMLMVFGPEVAALVYGSTILALTLSFLVGRLVPSAAIIRLLSLLGLRRAARLLARLAPLDQRARLGFLVQNASGPVEPFLLRHRYLALMLALNLPGNFVIGGGGGICLAVGFCRLYSLPGFILSVMLAVLPVPLLALLIGR